MNQVHDLSWHTAVFRTLNEARRLEPERVVNGAMWELIAAGYANLMTLGVRRLVDRDPRTDSVWNVVAHIEKHPGLLRRENIVCYDGLPYDTQAAFEKSLQAGEIVMGQVRWAPTRGPKAWGTSQLLHKSFDALAGFPERRTRLDKVKPEIIVALKLHLQHDSIQAVCTLADKVTAHAERIAENSGALPVVTYNTIDEALKRIIQVASFLSGQFFHDAALGSVVPTPQFDVLEGLDQPWVQSEHLPQLHEHWHELSQTMEGWADRAEQEFLSNRPRLQDD